MSFFLRLMCAGCDGIESHPKTSFSTDSSLKNNLKQPMSHMEQIKKRFEILLANDNKVIILEKSIFRILGFVTQTFYNKKGLTKKIKNKSFKKTHISQSSHFSKEYFSHSHSKSDDQMKFVNELNLKVLMNCEEGFFANEKILHKFFENFSHLNLIMFYSSSFATQIFKELVIFL